MPEMNGLEFLVKVKELYPEVSKIILTGYADKENAIKYVLGLLDNIEKDLPSQPKKLAPRYFERYGKELFYATFRVNKHTHWYVFFNVYQKENGTIFLVKYISNNHVIAQYL